MDPPDLLSKKKCLEYLAALRHAKWFQVSHLKFSVKARQSLRIRSSRIFRRMFLLTLRSSEGACQRAAVLRDRHPGAEGSVSAGLHLDKDVRLGK